MIKTKLSENERAIIIGLRGNADYHTFMMENGMTIGSIFQITYSPKFLGLQNIKVGNKLLSLRLAEFEKIEWLRI